MLYWVCRVQKEVVNCLDLVSVKLDEGECPAEVLGMSFISLFDPKAISYATNVK